MRGLREARAGRLASDKRRQPSNRRLPDELGSQAIEIVRERYVDFGPTLACEKLLELHDLQVSRETLRAWLIGAGIWIPRHERVRTAHQPRHRRECLGELVQLDGCEHAWFEDRGPGCTLLVYVDDATGRLLELRFVRTELNIDIICANSPQAQGRVERMNKTLQDRLLKELRLRGTSTIGAGNAFLLQFMADHNRRFGRAAKNAHDAHRSLRGHEDLSRIFTWREERRMSRNLVVRFKGITYLVEPSPETLRFAGKRVRVFESWRASGSALLSRSSGFAAGAGQVRRASKKLTFARRSARGRADRSGTFPTIQPGRAQRARSSSGTKRSRKLGGRCATIEPRSAARLRSRPRSSAAPVDRRCPTGHFYFAGERTFLLGFDKP